MSAIHLVRGEAFARNCQGTARNAMRVFRPYLIEKANLTFRELLAYAATYLAEHGIEQPRIEAEAVVLEALSLTRAWLYAHRDEAVSEPDWGKVARFIHRRGNREPLAYIAGHKEFFGLDFAVDPRVLIPRPETEMLVDEGIAVSRSFLEGLATRSSVAVADVGTGSGAVAISVAVNVPQAIVYAVDVSRGAIEVARSNCQRHGVEGRVTLLKGDLLKPVPTNLDIILANPPYIKDIDLADLQPEVRDFEPMLALRGGKAGLTTIRRLLRQSVSRLSRQGVIAFEIAWDQGQAAASLAKAIFPYARVEVRQDLAGLDRMVEIDLRQSQESQ